ncbi:cysteine protease StiP family protein [Peribacillus kribbensis]|uniref:cysteine protease StiP family protein n=1 Tax=Peribacillus kribbensis TaxID=356658 RepID=UPI00040B53A9|nr:cysteine protease StiP family protein [Peribacillus kribbensis]
MESFGSYSKNDVVFLLKDISYADLEGSASEREAAMQNHGHYSESLPIEYQPSPDYISLFHDSLTRYKRKIAVAVQTAAEKIYKEKGSNIVLVSLARAGTPVGILLKRYLSFAYGLEIPHYSVSIIRGRGLDLNALKFIVKKHGGQAVQFVDGWTGKGAITRELTKSVEEFNAHYSEAVGSSLAVLADPGECADIYGTREDFLIPSACLNSTVSGLISRTVLNSRYIGEQDFHGAKFYRELAESDLSNYFVDQISDLFSELKETALEPGLPKTWRGLRDIERLKTELGLDSINLIKPGVGETTRVLLRRVPWKILVKSRELPELAHILYLAEERNVPVEIYEEMSYSCIGLIQPVKGEQP